MKRKIIIALSVCLVAAVSIINVHLTQSDHKMNFSLADITLMAYADLEGGGSKFNNCRDLVNYTCYEFENKCDCIHMVEPVWPPYNCKDNIPGACR